MDTSIDSRQLRGFVALVHRGSLKKAAAELMVTESAISHAIRKLEASLGTKLFERKGKSLSLTPAGSVLSQDAVEILRRMRNIRGRLLDLQKTTPQTLRIAAGASFIKSMLPDILTEFRECFPEIQVSLYPAARDMCLSRIARDEADAAILVNMDTESSALATEKLFSDELELILARKHPLAVLKQVPSYAICREPVLVVRRSCHTTRLIENEMANHSFELQNIVEVGSQEALREMVRLGLGVSFQAPWAFQEGWNDPSIAWRSMPSLNLRRNWFFVWPNDAPPSKHLATLHRLCVCSTARHMRRIDLEPDSPFSPTAEHHAVGLAEPE